MFPTCSQAWACNTNIDDAHHFPAPTVLTVGPRILSLLCHLPYLQCAEYTKFKDGGKWPFKRAACGRWSLLTDGQDRWQGDLPWQRGFKWLYYVQNFNGVLDLFGGIGVRVSIQILESEAICMYRLHYKVGRWVLNGYFSLTSPRLLCYEHTIRSGLHCGTCSWSMADGLFSWSDLMVQLPWFDFFKNQFYKAFGCQTMCKRNVDREEWPCTENWRCWFFLIHVQRGKLWEKKIKFDHSFVYIVFIYSSTQKNELIITIFLYHGPLHFSTKGPLLPLPPQNMLDHVSG